VSGDEALVAGLRDLDLTPAQAAYLDVHSRRYAVLLGAVRECVAELPAREGPVRVLDVGPALQTVLIRRALGDATVDTLGFRNPLAEPREGERHFDLDLNRLADPGPRPDVPQHDVVVLAEVMEHLAAPPLRIFDAIAGWIVPGGGLVVQTPNALALHKRIRALAGRSPLGEAGDVRAGSHSQAHFREYTLDELAELAEASGLEMMSSSVANHFRHEGAVRRAYDRITEALPAGTRQGITAYLRRR
jgi:hypothetical protein